VVGRVLRFLTAGESHGPGLTAILEGMPPGVSVSLEELAAEQKRRRWCYGRGGRAEIEQDDIQITGGIHKGLTTGAPVSVFIPNRDYANWIGKDRPIMAPRPGHADLAGAAKYGFLDCRAVAERASARETAARVACGYFAKKLLEEEGIEILSWVTAIGEVASELPPIDTRMHSASACRELATMALSSPVRCPDKRGTEAMMRAIDAARECGDTLGGTFEAVATGVPAGLGSYVHWDRRLDTALAGAVMSINGVKGVEIGGGFSLAQKPGSMTHDSIEPPASTGGVHPSYTVTRGTNRAGGIEGGVSNGEVIFIRAAQKPIPMLRTPLPSININTGEACPAHFERSDVSTVGCAAVIAESMVALILAAAWLDRHGHDGLTG
jgi:chorismate synthase